MHHLRRPPAQFFITCAKADWLNTKHVVFGRVVDGMLTVRKVENTPPSRRWAPAAPVPPMAMPRPLRAVAPPPPPMFLDLSPSDLVRPLIPF